MLLIVVWVGVNAGLYAHYGIKTGHDSFRYLNYAQQIMDGSGWYEPHNVWYLGYVVFVLGVKGAFGTDKAIIAGQIMMNAIAAVALYRASHRLFCSREAALTTAILFISWVEISMWNFFVLAESWYISLICLVLYAVVSFNGSPIRWLVTTLLVLLTFATKPTGIGILLGYSVFLLSYYWGRIHPKKMVVVLTSLLFLTITYHLVNSMLSTFVLSENYTTGEIIYRASKPRIRASQPWLAIDPIHDAYIPPVTMAPLLRLVSFIFHNSAYFFQLFFAKLLFFVAHVRPYFSWLHNSVIVGVIYPLYVLMVRVLAGRSITRSLTLFFAVVLCIGVTSVSLTTLDWDGRFFAPLLPIVFLLGVGGGWSILNTETTRLFR